MTATVNFNDPQEAVKILSKVLKTVHYDRGYKDEKYFFIEKLIEDIEKDHQSCFNCHRAIYRTRIEGLHPPVGPWVHSDTDDRYCETGGGMAVGKN